jgi:hypothetical protein
MKTRLLNTRTLLSLLTLPWLALMLAGPALAKPAAKRGKRVLVFTRSQGFEHSVVKVNGDAPPFAMGVLSALATPRGWQLTHTKDGSVFTPEGLKEYDGFLFITTGDLTALRTEKDGKPDPPHDINQKPMSAEGKKALLDAVAAGKGFMALHNGSDTFHSAGDRWETQTGDQVDPYIAMLGGEFISHGDQQKARAHVVDRAFPGFGDIGDVLEFHEEWYSLKNLPKDLHALLVLETDTMKNPQYARPMFPVAWARMQGKGRVFYTALGHREDVWTHPAFHKMLVGGMSWALGEKKANVTPNVEKVTPGFQTLPAKPKEPATASGGAPAAGAPARPL